MSLIIIEGSRKSGKTHLVNSQSIFPVFKFDFNSSFQGLGLEQHSKRTHLFGLGKEIMLHQLNRDGFIKDQVIIDRGIITNSVWGVLQKRTSLEEATKEILWAVENGLLKNTRICVILGTYPLEREKDLWDFADSTIEEEKSLFIHFFNILLKKGIDVITFTNTFDKEAENRFEKYLKQ